jgi:hypothetical protein
VSEGTAGDRPPLLAYVHIPRTGGGSTTSAVSRNYARTRSGGNFQRNPRKTDQSLKNAATRLESADIRFVADHIPLGLYRRNFPADTRYMTVLREPVDRVLSHYYFHALAGERKVRNVWARFEALDRHERERAPDEPFADLPEDVGDPEGDVSLEAGLARRIPIYDNFQTRFLWGGESFFGDLPADALERAKENVAGFAFVGVTERLDESIVLLGRMLGMGVMPYMRRHVREKRPPLSETPARVRELIEEHNALDIELYRFARARFDELAAGEGLEADVEELRRRTEEGQEAAETAVLEKKAARRASRGLPPKSRKS